MTAAGTAGMAAAAGGGAAEVIAFWVLAVIALGSAVAMITMRNVVHGALMLVVNLLAIAVLYLVLQSGFLAIIQIIVYAGAIMVLFLFVLMLLGVARDDVLIERRTAHQLVAGALAGALALSVVVAFTGTYTGPASVCGQEAAAGEAVRGAVACAGLDAALEATRAGAVGFVAERLFTRHVFAFELVALLLLVATIGAMVLGRRRDDHEPSGVEPAPPSDREVVLGATAEEP